MISRIHTRLFLLMPCLALFAACSSDRDGATTQTAGAAPDPFVGEYVYPDEQLTVLRVTRDGGQYFGSILGGRDGPFLPAVAAVECSESVGWDLEDLGYIDPVYICFPHPEGPDFEPLLLLHARATSVVPEFYTTTGYYFDLVREGVERTGPVAEEYARYLAATRPAPIDDDWPVLQGVYSRVHNPASAALDAAFWDRLEFRPNRMVRAHGVDGFESAYVIEDDVLRPEGTSFVWRIHPDGCLVLAGNIRYCN
jgi:hypothetical protein